jgi:hypothetical protein
MLVLHHKDRRKAEVLVAQVVAGHAFVEGRLVVGWVLAVEEQDLAHLGHRFLTLFHQTDLLDRGQQMEVGAMVRSVHVPQDGEADLDLPGPPIGGASA